MRELGEYQCWGEVTVTLDGVEESLKKTHVIIVDALSPTGMFNVSFNQNSFFVIENLIFLN